MIPFNKPPYTGNEDKYVLQAMKSNKISGDGYFGKKCQEWFEDKLHCKKALLAVRGVRPPMPHATAVQRDEHLVRCLLYMDLNMCRAKVVKHPGEWKDCGYHEIVKPRQRYKLISRTELAEFLDIDEEILSDQYKRWIEEALGKGSLVRDDIWTTQPAVGSESYVNQIKRKLGYFVKELRAKERGECVFKEEPAVYGKEKVKEDNTLEWDIFPEL